MTQPVVLITGASSGIGYACAIAFSQAGYRVVATARRADKLAELQQAVGSQRDLLPVAADVTQGEAMVQAVAQARQHFGRLDVVIANAGIGHRGALAEARWEDIETLLRTNIDGVLHTVRAAVPLLKQSGGGHIFTISSVAYDLTMPYAAVYAASKAFVTSLSHSLRLELEDDHIRVSDVIIGRTATEFNNNRLGLGKRTGESLPTMTPDQVAAIILRATRANRRTVFARFFDRLTLLGNLFVPELIGRVARKDYR